MLLHLRNGEDPFARRLSICGVLQRAIDVFRSMPSYFLSIGLISAIPSFALNWLMISNMDKLMELFQESLTGGNPEEVNQKLLEFAMGLIGWFLLVMIVAIVITTVLKVAMIRATIQIYIGQDLPDLVEDLKHGVRLLGRLFCLGCTYICTMYGVAILVGAMLGIITVFLTAIFGDNAIFLVTLMLLVFEIAVCYIAYCLIFWDVIVVVEDLPGFQPFVRSFNLVKGQWCFVFCAVLLESLAVLGVSLIATLCFSSLGVVAHTLAVTLMGIAITPYTGIFLTVLYVNSRIQHPTNSDEENVTATMLAHEMKLDGSTTGGGMDSSGAGAYSALNIDQHDDDETEFHDDPHHDNTNKFVIDDDNDKTVDPTEKTTNVNADDEIV